jgi:hypothetical protein
MLDGAPRESWDFSVVLRRILYPLVAYPFMKLLGFGAGGLVVNVLLATGSLTAFWYAARHRFGADLSYAALWLLATYPGYVYWGGSPYSYAAIVPLSLLSLVVLWRLQTVTTWREAFLYGLVLGILFTGYDLLPFFGVAGILLLARRRLWSASAALAVAALIPQLLVLVGLHRLWGVAFRNSNNEVYATILRSYLSPIDGLQWGELLARIPAILVDNFLYGNFLFLPLLFLFGLLAATRTSGERPTLVPAEKCVLLAGLLVFLVNNAAPPYEGWQMRGPWISRLYQPVGVVMLAFLGRFYGRLWLLPRSLRFGSRAALALVVGLNAWVIFAPLLLRSPLMTGLLYYRFFQHSSPSAYVDNLKRFGFRPIGFCASTPTSAAIVMH